MKFCEVCLAEIDGAKDGENRCPECKEIETLKKHKRRMASVRNRERHELLTSLGLKRVRGALGGVYYE